MVDMGHSEVLKGLLEVCIGHLKVLMGHKEGEVCAM